MPREERPTARSNVPTQDAAAKALRRLARKETLLYTELEAPLRRAVLLYWASMAGARTALGLREPPAPRQAWSRERVIAEMRKLHRSGQQMSTSAVIAAAARAAGISAWPVRTRRRAASRDHVIQLIQKWNRAGRPVDLSVVRITPGGHHLVNSAFHHFSTWREAVKAAALSSMRQ